MFLLDLLMLDVLSLLPLLSVFSLLFVFILLFEHLWLLVFILLVVLRLLFVFVWCLFSFCSFLGEKTGSAPNFAPADLARR